MATSTQNPAPAPSAPDRLDILAGTPGPAPAGMARFSLQGGLVMASVDGAAPIPVAVGGAETNERSLANSLIGAGSPGLAFFFHQTALQLQNGHTLQISGSATIAPVAGAYRMSTGATAGTLIQAGIGHDIGAFGTPARTGQPWYIVGRFAVTTAITAQTRAFVGMSDSTGTPSLQAGVNGATSTGFFSLVGTAGAAIITTIPIDTLQHTHRAWRVGGTTFYQIDGGQIFSGTADIGVASGFFIQIFNGTDAVNRSWDFVFYGGACPFL